VNCRSFSAYFQDFAPSNLLALVLLATHGPSRSDMRSKSIILAAVLATGGALVMTAAGQVVRGQGAAAPQVTVDTDDIGGVVTGPNGPEAGVWVIAETSEVGTKMRKI